MVPGDLVVVLIYDVGWSVTPFIGTNVYDFERWRGYGSAMPMRGGAMYVSMHRRHYVGKNGRKRIYKTHLLRRSAHRSHSP